MAQPDDGPEQLKAALERSEAEVAALRAEVLSLKRIQISPTFLPVAEPVSPGAPLDLGLGGGIEVLWHEGSIEGVTLIASADDGCAPAARDHAEPQRAEVGVGATAVLKVHLASLAVDRKSVELGAPLASRRHCTVSRATFGGLGAVAKAPQDLQEAYREVALLASTRHPHVVQLLGCCLGDPERPLLLMECAQGTLDDFLKRRSGGLSRDAAAEILAHVALALAHLHGRHPAVVHRDVKPKNILLCAGGVAKLADFGLATLFPGGELNDQYKMSGAGTWRFMAPEVFRGEPYSAKVDIYSWAMVLYNVLTGQLPFAGVEHRELRAIHRGPHSRPAKVQNRRFRGLLQRAWAEHPGERPTAAALAAEIRRKPRRARLRGLVRRASALLAPGRAPAPRPREFSPRRAPAPVAAAD